MKRIEILIRRLILELYLFFYPENKKVQEISVNPKSKILFIRLNRIGDALVSTPLLYNLKKYTDHKIIVLASKYNYFIYNKEIVDNVIIYDKSSNNILRVIKEINKISPDVIIDLHEDVSTTVSFILGFSRSKYKIGFHKKNHKLYNYLIPKPDTENIHVVDRILLFQKLFLPTVKNDINIHFNIGEISLNKIDNYLISNQLTNKFIIGLNISAGSKARFWSIENYKRLVNELKEQFNNIEIIIMCTENDLSKAKEIAENKFLVFYDNSFEVFSALVSKLNLLITPDTSIVHIASAFNIPVFGLYVKYNTNDMIWSPYKSKFEFVVTNHATLHNIKYEQVINKLKPFLESLLWKT